MPLGPVMRLSKVGALPHCAGCDASRERYVHAQLSAISVSSAAACSAADLAELSVSR